MNNYHILYSNFWGTKNIFDLNKEQLQKVIDAYNYGKSKIFIRGELHSFDRLHKIKIFEATRLWSEKTTSAQKYADEGLVEQNYGNTESYLNYKGMTLFGKDVTEEMITMDFGELENKQIEADTGTSESQEVEHEEFEFDYAIISALYREELKFIEPYINYAGEIENDEKKLIRYGSLKTNPEIRIIYASLLNTGMIDAAIFTTDIITRYKPKVLLMPGVCGGRDDNDLNLLDIIIASKVYTFQKGKLKESGFEGEWEGIDLNDKLIQKIQTQEEIIVADMRYQGKVHYEPMACSTAVIDKAGIFDEIAISKDRKTLGLEMEGYGVARACQIANNGQTKALIIKSVMDKTAGKNDHVKLEAAQNSANFVMTLIELEIV
jgi:nucleoside phosphorylase